MIANLSPGDTMDLDVLVVSYELKYSEKVKNNYFLSIQCKDASGEISVKVFDKTKANYDIIVELLKDNRFIHVSGNVEDYKGRTNVKALSIEFIDDPEDMSYFEKSSPIPISVLEPELDAAIEKVSNPFYKNLLINLIGQEGKYRDKFLIWPAAKSKHHDYRHGLLQHSLEVFNNVEHELISHSQMHAESQNTINWDSMKCAALIHDVAKVIELDYKSGAATYTNEGNLIGHLCYGSMICYHEINNIEDFPKEDSLTLLHILLSHHGRTDWGAAIEPKNIEAEIFHMCDHKSALYNKNLKSATQG